MGDNKYLASLGRFGDNKLRDVDGEMSHVNAFEAWWSDNLPKETADRMIKSHGAGTRNPSTGLKEYHQSNKKIWEKGWHPHPHFNQIDDWLADRAEEGGEALANEDLDFSWSSGFTVAETPLTEEYLQWRKDHDIARFDKEQLFDYMSTEEGFEQMMDRYDLDEDLMVMAGKDYEVGGMSMKSIEHEAGLNLRGAQEQISTGITDLQAKERQRVSRSGFESGGASLTQGFDRQKSKLLSAGQREMERSRMDTEKRKRSLMLTYYDDFLDLINA